MSDAMKALDEIERALSDILAAYAHLLDAEDMEDHDIRRGEYIRAAQSRAEKIAIALPALQAAEHELKRAKLEAAALRALCKEAADLYAQGGTFPIKGEMSMNLLHASNGHLAAPHHTGTLRAALTPPADDEVEQK